MRWLLLVDAQGHLVGDGYAVAFEGDDLFGVVGEDANIFEAEIDQDLRADAAFVLDHALARGFAVELAALMKMNLRQGARFPGGIDGEAAAGVVEIQEHAAVFLGDSFQRKRDEFAAIAGRGAKHISRKAVRVDADERGRLGFEVAAHHEHNGALKVVVFPD